MLRDDHLRIGKLCHRRHSHHKRPPSLLTAFTTIMNPFLLTPGYSSSGRRRATAYAEHPGIPCHWSALAKLISREFSGEKSLLSPATLLQINIALERQSSSLPPTSTGYNYSCQKAWAFASALEGAMTSEPELGFL